MLLTSLVDDRVDPLTGEEVLLRVFDFGSVVEGRVHIPVTMRVRDALHGPGRRLAEGDGCRRALNGDDLEIFTGTLSGRCLFLSFGLLGPFCFSRFWILCSSIQKQKPVTAVGIPRRTTSAPMLISIIVSPHKSRRAAGRGPPCCWAYSSTSSK